MRLITDDEGNVVARYEFDAFGNELPGSFDNVPGGMAYKFVGGLGCRTDPTTSLVYMRQRWYDPTLQRFISRDPIGLMGGVNIYSYAKNNPVRLTDSRGMAPGDYEGEWELDARVKDRDYYRRKDPLDSDITEYTNEPQTKCPPRRRKIKWPPIKWPKYKWVPPPFDFGPVPDFTPPPPEKLKFDYYGDGGDHGSAPDGRIDWGRVDKEEKERVERSHRIRAEINKNKQEFEDNLEKARRGNQSIPERVLDEAINHGSR
ncbi:MAG: RHS repeat-associated core domain-containing protein [Candidatus Eremiobacteraeota bacterium]|nr:RHS repeat-associated core domain-containing protein [Candidatus Eremiobacteraeota bacterium]